MVLAETFWQVIWTMFIFFMWVLWIWLLIIVFMDVFRNRESSGLAKAGWCIFVILLPFLGVFIYLIVEGKGMAERRTKEAQAMPSQLRLPGKGGRGSRRPDRADREREATARQRRDHPGRVRRAQAKGARLI